MILWPLVGALAATPIIAPHDCDEHGLCCDGWAAWELVHDEPRGLSKEKTLALLRAQIEKDTRFHRRYCRFSGDPTNDSCFTTFGTPRCAEDPVPEKKTAGEGGELVFPGRRSPGFPAMPPEVDGGVTPTTPPRSEPEQWRSPQDGLDAVKAAEEKRKTTLNGVDECQKGTAVAFGGERLANTGRELLEEYGGQLKQVREALEQSTKSPAPGSGAPLPTPAAVYWGGNQRYGMPVEHAQAIVERRHRASVYANGTRVVEFAGRLPEIPTLSFEGAPEPRVPVRNGSGRLIFGARGSIEAGVPTSGQPVCFASRNADGTVSLGTVHITQTRDGEDTLIRIEGRGADSAEVVTLRLKRRSAEKKPEPGLGPAQKAPEPEVAPVPPVVAPLPPVPPKDTDGDGVPDEKDLCPEEPGRGELDGCPAPISTDCHQYLLDYLQRTYGNMGNWDNVPRTWFPDLCKSHWGGDGCLVYALRSGANPKIPFIKACMSTHYDGHACLACLDSANAPAGVRAQLQAGSAAAAAAAQRQEAEQARIRQAQEKAQRCQQCGRTNEDCRATALNEMLGSYCPAGDHDCLRDREYTRDQAWVRCRLALDSCAAEQCH